MTVGSVEFLAALLGLAAVFFYIPAGWPRRLVLALCNAVFLASCIRGIRSWAVLAVFILSGYIVTLILQKISESQTKRLVFWCYLAALLAAFVVLKEYQFLDIIIPAGSITKWVSIVGLSYMLFRQIHFVVDGSEGQLEHVSLWRYLNYQLGLFTLVSGPIQRYQDFCRTWDSTRPILADRHERMKAYARVLIGILKVSILGDMALRFSHDAASRQLYSSSPRDIATFAVLFYTYPLSIYFNFSGYCDIVIAGASLLGLHLPENFNRPYLSRNVIDYWTRWHMTLTNWIRDYIFMPLYKLGMERQVMKPHRLGYACFFVALFLAGVWHGSSWNYAVFGLIHGSGVTMTKMWEERILRRKGRAGLREYLKSMPIRIAAIVLTLNFVCFAFLFFPTDLKGRVVFLGRFIEGKPPAQKVVAPSNEI
jgi:D-alanyl-lipoteichoic acid acyltransferase DltB (MBOAT superfamily)